MGKVSRGATTEQARRAMKRRWEEHPEEVIWGWEGDGTMGVMVNEIEVREPDSRGEFGLAIVRRGQQAGMTGLSVTRDDLERIQARIAELLA